jgi:hypothetical protein
MVAALKSAPEHHNFVQPPGIVQATVCVPSGIVAKPGMNCPTVTSLFAADALAKQQNVSWWGGQQLSSKISVNDLASGIPAEITGWKRYLAQEYQRSYHGARPPSGQQVRGPAPAPAAPAPQVQPPVAVQPPPQPPPQRGRGRGR